MTPYPIVPRDAFGALVNDVGGGSGGGGALRRGHRRWEREIVVCRFSEVETTRAPLNTAARSLFPRERAAPTYLAPEARGLHARLILRRAAPRSAVEVYCEATHNGAVGVLIENLRYLQCQSCSKL